jgi:hypothetical protein
MEPVPVAVRLVVPVMEVLPMEMLELEPLSVKVRLPPVRVPVVEILAVLALSVTLRVPLPTLEVLTVRAVLESVTDVVPDVAVALSDPALVLEMVAPPVPVDSDSVPVPTVVAAV